MSALAVKSGTSSHSRTSYSKATPSGSFSSNYLFSFYDPVALGAFASRRHLFFQRECLAGMRPNHGGNIEEPFRGSSVRR
jgi:hypothetical protein